MNDTVRAIVLGVALIAIVGGVVWWFVSRPPEAKPEEEPAAVVTTHEPSKSGQPILVALGGSAGPADMMMAAVLTALRQGFGRRLEIEFVNVGNNSELKAKYGVRITPVQIYYSPEGKELYRHTAYASEQQILDQWKKLGYDLLGEPIHKPSFPDGSNPHAGDGLD